MKGTKKYDVQVTVMFCVTRTVEAENGDAAASSVSDLFYDRADRALLKEFAEKLADNGVDYAVEDIEESIEKSQED